MVYPFFRMESYVPHGKRIAWETYHTGSNVLRVLSILPCEIILRRTGDSQDQ